MEAMDHGNLTYSETVLQHFEQPCQVGYLDMNAVDVGTGIAGTPDRGDALRLQIRVDSEGIIVETKFKADGGVATIAAGSLISQWLMGKTLAEGQTLDDRQISEALALSPLKIQSAVLAAQATRAAIENYLDKHPLAPTAGI